jgi:hypothetical protein
MQIVTTPADTKRFIVSRIRSARGGVLIASGLAISAVVVSAMWSWGTRSLDGLPDVGDPFDVAAARRSVEFAESDNAYVLYAEAKDLLSRVPPSVSQIDFAKLSWSTAGPEARAFLEQNREALEVWRRGTERPDALYNQPGRLAMDTLLPIVQEIQTFAKLAALEGSRLDEKGAMNEAWNWYRAILRSSRHVGKRGVIIERMVGASIHRMALPRILRWGADSRVDRKLLRAALDDSLAAEAMTAPLSDALKLEYVMYLRDLEELRVMVREIPMPGGRFGLLEQMANATGAKPQIQRIRLLAANDVERSRRVLRLLFANWLAQVDRPSKNRAPIAVQTPTLIYAADSTAPWAARALAPEDLNIAIDRTSLASEIFRSSDPATPATPMARAPWEGDGPLARETRDRATLIVTLAAELYRRDHGGSAATATALLGRYLDSLPEGLEKDDPIARHAD